MAMPANNQYRLGTVAVRFVCYLAGGSGSYNTYVAMAMPGWHGTAQALLIRCTGKRKP